METAFYALLDSHESQFRPQPVHLEALLSHDKFARFRDRLLRRTATHKDLDSIVAMLQLGFTTTSVSKFGAVTGVLLDGDIPGAYGQRGTALQYAFRGSELLCAKIGPGKLKREAVAWRAVSEGCSTPALLPILSALDAGVSCTGDSPRTVLLMPLAAMSVGAAAGAFVGATSEPLAAQSHCVLVANCATCAARQPSRWPGGCTVTSNRATCCWCRASAASQAW